MNDLVDESISGSYAVLYNVADGSGNQAEQLVRQLVVVDRIPPIIAFVGNAVLKQELKEPYVDPGATALDNVDGNLTGQIEVVNPVNVEADGTYSEIYRERQGW